LHTTQKIIESAFKADLDKIDSNTLIRAKQLIRDGFGVMLLGLEHQTIKILVDYFKDIQTREGVDILKYGIKGSTANASYIYGCATHSMDFEPMFLPPTHVVSPVLSPLIALIQEGKGNGELLLKAFIVGIQLEADLRKGARSSDEQAAKKEHHFPFDKHGFHPPGTVGPLGSALSSSIMLGLDVDKTRMAIGHAASRSSGISGNIGTMTKSTHCGNAARSGLESAFLIEKGLTASRDIIECQSGWANVFAGSAFDMNSLQLGMEKLNCFTSPGFAFKKWPAHTAMQVAIDAALKLNYSGSAMDRIDIKAPVFKYCDRPFPNDSDEARFSFQYNVALAILDGEINNESYTSDKLNSQEVQTFLQKTLLTMDKSIPRDFGEMSIEISTSDGQKSKSDSWPGHWKNPASEEELLGKFINCTQDFWNKDKAIEISDMIMNIEQGDNFERLRRTLNDLAQS